MDKNIGFVSNKISERQKCRNKFIVKRPLSGHVMSNNRRAPRSLAGLSEIFSCFLLRKENA